LTINQSIGNILGEEMLSLLNYKYTVYADFALEVEGHRGIKVFSSTYITFAVGKSTLVVEGENLTIKQLTKNYALITGTITWAGVQRK